MQGLEQVGTNSAPTSRRPSVVSVEPIRSHIPVFPGSTESSAPGTPAVQVSPEDFGMIPFTPPLLKSPAPQPPPPPDFDKAPYSNPTGPVFEGDEWARLVDRLEDKVACDTLGQGLNLPIQRLRSTGLHYNVLSLDEETLKDITRDCWWIM